MSNSNAHSPFPDQPAEPPSPKTLLGAITGCGLGFFLGAGLVVLIRGLDSENDGLRALWYSLSILVPIFLVGWVVWFVQRKQSRPLNKTILGVALFGGLCLGGSVWLTVPTDWELEVAAMDAIRPPAARAANAFAKFREIIEAFPTDSVDQITPEQIERLRKTPFNYLSGTYEINPDWNCLLYTSPSPRD